MYYVYVYSHPETGIPFYVGKGKGNRYKKHLKETKENTENYKKWAFIEGLRNKGLEPIIEKVFNSDNEDAAYNEEERLIKHYGRKDIDKDGILTNICESSRPPKRNKPLTEEHKQKISDAHKGHAAYNPDYKHSEETKKKIGAANKVALTGRKLSDEHKNAIAKGKEGIDLSHTEESKKKISEAHKGKPKSEEHKKALREAKTKKPQVHSEETKKKMAESQRKRWQQRQLTKKDATK
ncbi:MAG TPA: NUMOD3 domain-containing DNA-binding protein [Methanosarcina sp.]|nr:NUMOD3 domain-containing DNA-binding protein [Methanosarcina sp.]